MKITALTLKNFKRFTDLTIQGIPYDAKLVLLIGANGSGKSSVFDAFECLNSFFKSGGTNVSQNYLSKDKKQDFLIFLC
jgi:ATPase involved in DNA repair